MPLPTEGEQAASMLAPLARELEGFSCREVEKLVLAIQRPSLQQRWGLQRGGKLQQIDTGLTRVCVVACDLCLQLTAGGGGHRRSAA